MLVPETRSPALTSHNASRSEKFHASYPVPIPSIDGAFGLRSSRSKDPEIVVSRHQLAVLNRQTLLRRDHHQPHRPWTTQATRNLFLRPVGRRTDATALASSRGSQFIDPFDEIFRTGGLKILKAPVRTPVANAFAERWIGSLRRELLDRTLIWNRRKLQRLIVD